MITYRILQNSSYDMSHVSILRFDKESYLFNCCDGTQRNGLDQGIKFTKINACFFNSNEISNYLGIYGLLMSRGEQSYSKIYSIMKQEIKETKGKIDSKSNNKKVKGKEKKLVLNKDFKEGDNPFDYVTQCELFGPPELSRNFMFSQQFCPVPLGRNLHEYDLNSRAFINKNISNYKDFKDKPMAFYEDKNLSVFPICTVNKELIGTDESVHAFAMSYICIPHLKSRPFLKQKAISLGVKPGPLFGKLAKGETITLENGGVVKPDDVLGEAIPTSCLLVLYVPDLTHMQNLVESETMKSFLKKKLSHGKYKAHIVTHILKDVSILLNESYIEFMKKFDKEVTHIIDCVETNRQFMYNSGKNNILHILNKSSSYLFAKEKFGEKDMEARVAFREMKEKLWAFGVTVWESVPGNECVLFPCEKRGASGGGINDGNASYYKSKEHQNLIEALSGINVTNIDSCFNTKEGDQSPKVTFLGTTSMKPCKFRNVTSILIHVPKTDSYVMFDCGEGTFQQIFEYYGTDISHEILLKLRLISISHKHGDHMLGLMKLITEIDKLLTKNKKQITADNKCLYLIVPSTIHKFVINSISIEIKNRPYFKVYENNVFNPNKTYLYQKFLTQEEEIVNFVDVAREENYGKTREKIVKFREENKAMCEEMFGNVGVYFNTIEVFHCNESYGFFIENSTDDSEPGYYKISFSGDTRPNNNFFNYSSNSTLLIHEGTFDAEMSEDAKEKMHSTVPEVIEIGTNNKSKFLAITHFSPRYIKTYPYSEEYVKLKIVFAHDFLSFKLSDLDHVHRYLRPFNEVLEYLENKKVNI